MSTKFKAATYTRLTALTKTRFATIKATLEEFAAKTEPLSAVQLRQLTGLSREISKKRDDYEVNLNNAFTLPTEEAIPDETLSSDQDVINDTFALLTALIETLTPSEPPMSPGGASSASTSVQPTLHSQVRLPKIDLPKFNGNPLSWTTFINLFDTTIHRNASLSAVMKFQYLLSVLSGEPLNLIKGLNLTVANYFVAYNLLRERYHNSRRLQALHLDQLLDLPCIAATDPKGLRHFVNTFMEHSQALAALECEVTESNPLLSALLLRKLDSKLCKKLEGARIPPEGNQPHSLPTVKEIIKFLTTECSQTEDANIHSASTSYKSTFTHTHARSKGTTPKKVHFRSSDVSMVTTTPADNIHSDAPPSQCFLCKSNAHKIYSCASFQKKSPQDRFQLVKQHRRCISCLGSHDLRDCQSQSTCRTCDKRHHTLLHFPTSQGKPANHSISPHYLKERQSSQPIKANTANPIEPSSSVNLTSQGQPLATPNCTSILLGTMLIKLTSANGSTHVFRALLDSGSMCDLITERAASLLNTRRFKSDVQLSGLSQNATRHKGQTYLNVETLSGFTIARRHPMLVLDNLTVDLPRVPISQEVVQRARRYVLADPTFHLPGRIDVILGGSLFPQLLTNEQFSLGPQLPHVLGTRFGFVVMGSAPCASPTTTQTHTLAPAHLNVTLLSTSDLDLHSSLQRFWSMEEPPVFKKKTQEEELCDRHFLSTCNRDSTGRYIVSLPFQETHTPLGTSRPQAERRFHSLERKFDSQPQFSTLYHEFVKEYISLDHMSLCSDLDAAAPHYFLPHHGILKEKSSTTKLRTVFDASSKTSTGVSLNDILLTGRKLQTNICDILVHFRCHNFVFSCDIRQMYRQILIHPDDRKFQLILWRDKPNEPLSTYKLNTVTYGVNSSPYLAIKTLHRLADDEGNSFPAAAQVLRTQTYVDDIITGAETEEAVLELQDQLVNLLRRGGFELRKWVSNSPRLLQTLPEGHLESPVFLQESDSPHFSILGIHWSPSTDCFTYNVNFPPDNRPTKRSVLSFIAKIYDPCGFLSPCMMMLKCFMQYLWTTGLSWDEPLPPDIAGKWQSFVADAQNLSQISIPRAFSISGSLIPELHGFSDASESGYAAVIYLRCQFTNGNVNVHPIMAKTRVSPLKRVTLPRLELCAAHMLAQLMSHCRALFKNSISPQHILLWCDSSVVLTWLHTPSYRLKTYVANRVAQTQELVPVDAWRHIASAENPADCASRGIYASQLINHALWWAGPSWLRLPHNRWPASHHTPVDLTESEEMKSTPLTVLTTAHHTEWELLTSFSSWTYLLRIVAWMLRFIHNCRNPTRLSGSLSASEINKARLKIFSLVQHSSFTNEILSLKNQRDCSTRLQRLKPFLDSDGLVRVGGRLNRSSLPRDSRHPVLLPKKHHIVDIMVDHCHKTHLHAGPQLTQAILAQTVWILCARSVVRSRIFKCITCFKNKPRNNSPLMGDLPASRVIPTRPFSSTGTDFCGPFTAKVFNLRAVRHIKVYICVFVCLVTKAVHLEVVTDLTTDAFIASLTRFVSRRGLCSHIYSDCGTNFVGADAALRTTLHSSLFSASSKEELLHFSSNRAIQFHFNPPAAPHQGGLWESAVKSAKHHLRRVMGESVLTLMEFSTLTTQIEAMLNSRPLTPLSNDPEDYTALTPGHFLIGAPLATVPEPEHPSLPTNRLKHWQLVQYLHQQIWKRWQMEYLHTLQQRSKWDRQVTNLKVGDLVLIHTNSPPLSWPLARVIAVHPGSDGVVRVVDLKTANGHLTRPAVKVFPLPLTD